jgi:hypothetical protein
MTPETDPSAPAAGPELPAVTAAGAPADALAAPADVDATAAPQAPPVTPEPSAASGAPEPPTMPDTPEAPEPLGAPDAPEAPEVPEVPGSLAPATAAVPEMTPAACAARLAELFPALFGADGPPRPVKLRVHADVQQRAPGMFTRRVLSAFLSRHTTTSAYLRGLVESPHRFDLDGQPAGEIADEHRQAAREELARRRALRRGPPAGKGQRPPAPTAQPGTHTGTHTDTDTGGGAGAPTPDRPARGPRPEGRARAGQPPRQGRPERAEGSARTGPAPDAGKPERSARPQRPMGPARGPQRPPRQPNPHPSGRDKALAMPEHQPAGDARTPAAPTPFDPAQRARHTLVRAWETSPLAKPNFCALMRVSVAELDDAIAQVQQERRERAR